MQLPLFTSSVAGSVTAVGSFAGQAQGVGLALGGRGVAAAIPLRLRKKILELEYVDMVELCLMVRGCRRRWIQSTVISRRGQGGVP